MSYNGSYSKFGQSIQLTDAEIKIQYENNPNTNPYTDADKSKLTDILPRTLIESTILYSPINAVNTIADDIETFTTANISLTSPPEITGLWTAHPTQSIFTFNGPSAMIFEIDCGGFITTDSVGDQDHVLIHMLEGTSLLTGSLKRYSAGKSLGSVTSDIGFTSKCFGKFSNGDTVTFQMARDFTGSFVLSQLLVAFKAL